MLIAILHDGTFDGDSAFYVSTSTDSENVFEYTGQSLEQLIEAFATKLRGEGLDDEADPNDEDSSVAEVRGAWILDEHSCDVIDAVLDDDFGSDSAVYRANRVAKRIAQKLATQTLGEPAGDFGDDPFNPAAHGG